MVTVGELIEALKQFPADYVVVLPGKGYTSPLADLNGAFDTGIYVPDSTWSGEFYTADVDLDDEYFAESIREELDLEEDVVLVPNTLAIYSIN